MSQIVEKVQKGQRQNQNRQHFKCRLTLNEGGDLNFSDFSQIQITEIGP